MVKSLAQKSAVSCAALLVAAVQGCSDNFMQGSTIDASTSSLELAATADAAGNYTAEMDPNASSTQLLKASTGAVAGSAIAMPPGALSIAVSITIGQGETLASSDISQQLGLSDNSASVAGPAVSFVPSTSVQASSPFTLSIPVGSSSSLALTEAKLNRELTVVMYKWMKVDNGVTTYAIGMLPPNELTIGSKAVQFQTTMFGTFQLATMQQPITQRITQPTAEPPMLRGDASNPLVGVWTSCQERNDYNNQGGGTGGGTSGGGSSTPPNIGPQVGGGCFVTPTASAPPELKLAFDDITGSLPVGTSVKFKVIRSRNSQISIGEKTITDADYTNLLTDLSLPLPAGSPNDIMGNESLAIVAPSGCYFSGAGGNTRVLDYSNWEYGLSIHANANLNDYVYLNTSLQQRQSDIDLRTGDLVEIVTTTTDLAFGEKYYVGNVSFTPDWRKFQLYSAAGVLKVLTVTVPIQFRRVERPSLTIAAGIFSTGSMTSSPFSPLNPFVMGEALSIETSANIFTRYFVSSSTSGQVGLSLTSGGPQITSGFSALSLKSVECRPINRKQFNLVCDGTTSLGLPSEISAALTWTPPPAASTNTSSSDDDRYDYKSLGFPNSMKVWEKSFVKFSSNTFIHSSAAFTGPQCSGVMINRIEETGTYTLGSQYADGSYPIDINMVTAKAGLLEPKAVEYANRIGQCGIKDWAVGVPRELESTPTCKPSQSSNSSKGPETLKIEAGKMYFKKDDGSGWDKTPMIKQ
jgi:hypothetical protein